MTEQEPNTVKEISKTEYLEAKLLELTKRYALLLEKTSVSEAEKPLPTDERIAELEIKMAKLWDLLTDKPKGRGKQETISKFGIRFRNKFSKD